MKIIKTTKEHEEAKRELEALMVSDPPEGSEEDEKIQLLALLIADYEKRTVTLPEVSPAEVIRYVMEDRGLKQQDLVPYIGSKARVSEILSGKRELTLKMIRALHHEFKIPLNVLFQEQKELPEEIDVASFPFNEMHKAGYFPEVCGKKVTEIKDRAEELLHTFFQGREKELILAFNRQGKGKANIDRFAVQAWRCRVLDHAKTMKRGAYSRENLNEALFSQLTALSAMDSGPLLVRDRLIAAGVAVVIEPHLTKTRLDGAALWHPDGFPVIGLSLRHNRLDNFWFTLFHELGHVRKHLDSNPQGFVDTDIDSASEKKIEQEADTFALNQFITPEDWEEVRHLTTAKEIRKAANQLAIHPAILAGRLRREAQDYSKHRTLIGQGEVKAQFGLQ
ncbi:ImmA/IrrE family metallo-endopeptidase [Roseibacillus persicicus]|uniref:ImmA/IrrE family metallo-endopeptidase n=1 Tax=Roseibacillus persicicus TaxID=454148 RepID=UPI00280F89CD|nr:ImmA/IrrE family metallo-endopeptidase [Roseibacillus persicicus]MDQ8190890.1 ImmA/IrrE family metallo-endopeptidase [Roseibacillus persicicus]